MKCSLCDGPVIVFYGARMCGSGRMCDGNLDVILHNRRPKDGK